MAEQYQGRDITYVPELKKVHVLPDTADGAELERMKQQHPRHTVLDPKNKAESINDAVMSSAKWQFPGLTAEQYERIFGGRDTDAKTCSQE